MDQQSSASEKSPPTAAVLPRGESNIAPSSFKFSADGKTLGCLHADSDNMRQLFSIPLPSLQAQKIQPPTSGDTEENLSLEEQLRRERQRQMSVGVTNFQWVDNEHVEQKTIVVSQGDIYVGSMPTAGQSERGGAKSEAVFRKVFDHKASPNSGGAIDPHFSPDGSRIAFVQDAELYVLALPSDDEADQVVLPAKVQRLTTGADPSQGKTNALADFIAQEEMDRYRGFWWSPDSKSIAFIHVDESEIPMFQIMHQGKEGVFTEEHRYPFAGDTNARIRLGVVNVPSTAELRDQEHTLPPPTTQWMNLAQQQDIYLARVDWLVDGSLTAQVQDRDQTLLRIMQYYPASVKATAEKRQPELEGRILLEEKAKYYTNLHHNLRSFMRPTKAGTEDMHLVWTSEADGYMHIYLFAVPSANGSNNKSGVAEGTWSESAAQLVRQLTSGPYVVETIEGVDVANETIYFTGTKTSALERHLYAAHMWDTTAPIRQLTHEVGMHTISMSKDCQLFVDSFSSLTCSPQVQLCKVPTSGDRATNPVIALIFKKQESPTTPPAPEIVEFSAADGETPLFGAVFRPDLSKFGPGPYKTIVWMYGGPHVQLVQQNWSLRVRSRVQMLRDLGYLLFVCDNRGSNRRGAEFEGATKHNLGDLEVQDQVAGIKYLVAQKLTQPGKVGCFGWSYGGYMTNMCLARAPDVFSVGVSGAPVTHWDGYDTHYTERYMGTPQSNPDGYEVSSVMHHAKNIKGKLMLIHGLIDENVHFRHTARLINALIEGNVNYDLLLFPCERHSPRKPQDNAYMAKRISEFFLSHL